MKSRISLGSGLFVWYWIDGDVLRVHLVAAAEYSEDSVLSEWSVTEENIDAVLAAISELAPMAKPVDSNAAPAVGFRSVYGAVPSYSEPKHANLFIRPEFRDAEHRPYYGFEPGSAALAEAGYLESEKVSGIFARDLFNDIHGNNPASKISRETVDAHFRLKAEDALRLAAWLKDEKVKEGFRAFARAEAWRLTPEEFCRIYLFCERQFGSERAEDELTKIRKTAFLEGYDSRTRSAGVHPIFRAYVDEMSDRSGDKKALLSEVTDLIEADAIQWTRYHTPGDIMAVEHARWAFSGRDTARHRAVLNMQPAIKGQCGRPNQAFDALRIFSIECKRGHQDVLDVTLSGDARKRSIDEAVAALRDVMKGHQSSTSYLTIEETECEWVENDGGKRIKIGSGSVPRNPSKCILSDSYSVRFGFDGSAKTQASNLYYLLREMAFRLVGLGWSPANILIPGRGDGRDFRLFFFDTPNGIELLPAETEKEYDIDKSGNLDVRRRYWLAFGRYNLPYWYPVSPAKSVEFAEGEEVALKGEVWKVEAVLPMGFLYLQNKRHRTFQTEFSGNVARVNAEISSKSDLLAKLPRDKMTGPISVVDMGDRYAMTCKVFGVARSGTAAFELVEKGRERGDYEDAPTATSAEFPPSFVDSGVIAVNGNGSEEFLRAYGSEKTRPVLIGSMMETHGRDGNGKPTFNLSATAVYIGEPGMKDESNPKEVAADVALATGKDVQLFLEGKNPETITRDAARMGEGKPESSVSAIVSTEAPSILPLLARFVGSKKPEIPIEGDRLSVTDDSPLGYFVNGANIFVKGRADQDYINAILEEGGKKEAELPKANGNIAKALSMYQWSRACISSVRSVKDSGVLVVLMLEDDGGGHTFAGVDGNVFSWVLAVCGGVRSIKAGRLMGDTLGKQGVNIAFYRDDELVALSSFTVKASDAVLSGSPRCDYMERVTPESLKSVKDALAIETSEFSSRSNKPVTPGLSTRYDPATAVRFKSEMSSFVIARRELKTLLMTVKDVLDIRDMSRFRSATPLITFAVGNEVAASFFGKTGNTFVGCRMVLPARHGHGGCYAVPYDALKEAVDIERTEYMKAEEEPERVLFRGAFRTLTPKRESTPEAGQLKAVAAKDLEKISDIDPGRFLQVFDVISLSASTDDTRPHLACVFLQRRKDHDTEIEMITTDGHRMAVAGTGMRPSVDQVGIAIVRGLFDGLTRYLKGLAENGMRAELFASKIGAHATDHSETWMIHGSDGSFFWSFTSHVHSGMFPSYEHVLPAVAESSLHLVVGKQDVPELLKASDAEVLRIDVDGESASISGRFWNKDKTVETWRKLNVPVQVKTLPKGGKLSVAVRGVYFLDGVKTVTVKGGGVAIHQQEDGGELDPVLFRSTDTGDRLSFVAMPMRQ